MTDNDVLEKKMHELREIGEKHAKARGNVSLLEHGRKILLSTIMKEVTKMINQTVERKKYA